MRRRERKGRSDMTAWQSYASPVGELLLAADEEGLTGLWLAGEKYFPGVPEDAPQETPVLEETKRWLDIYFTGREPDFLPPLHPAGSPFRQEAWALLRQIPYGETTTYRALAEAVAGSGACGRCRPKRWVALWDTTPSPSSSPVIGWWAATVVSPAMPEDWSARCSC